MFIDDLVDMITGDTSVNALATGGIKYEHLPVDFNSDLDWVVFGYTADNELRTLDGAGSITYYGLEVQTISKSMTNVLALSETIRTYLSSYDDGSNIRDVAFDTDGISYNPEKQVYYLTANYSILYVN